MLGISKVLYQVFLKLYYVSAVLLSPFYQKATKWVKGRRDSLKAIRDFHSSKKTIWIHCASLGEYEQASPIIEGLSKRYVDHEIVLTFFSSSGYEIVSKKKLGVQVFYLPHDSKRNAKEFIRAVNPALAVFVKYDLWYYYVATLKEHRIPVVLISAIFRTDDIFFKWYGVLFRKMLDCLSLVLVQDEDSERVLKANGIDHCKVTGDTRLDRVVQIKQENEEVPLLFAFKGDSKTFIAGSTEPNDIPVIEKFVSDFKDTPDLKIIIAPHDISEPFIDQLMKRLAAANPIRYSQATEKNVKAAQLLIIDNIGWLSKIYRYCELAYIGGGFDQGIHNILEPVVFGIPVIFGPKYEKFNEAKDLVALGGAFAVSDYEQLKERFSLLFDQPDSYQRACNKATEYISKEKGATEDTLKAIDSLIAQS